MENLSKLPLFFKPFTAEYAKQRREEQVKYGGRKMVRGRLVCAAARVD